MRLVYTLYSSLKALKTIFRECWNVFFMHERKPSGVTFKVSQGKFGAFFLSDAGAKMRKFRLKISNIRYPWTIGPPKPFTYIVSLLATLIYG